MVKYKQITNLSDASELQRAEFQNRKLIKEEVWFISHYELRFWNEAVFLGTWRTEKDGENVCVHMMTIRKPQEKLKVDHKIAGNIQEHSLAAFLNILIQEHQ